MGIPNTISVEIFSEFCPLKVLLIRKCIVDCLVIIDLQVDSYINIKLNSQTFSEAFDTVYIWSQILESFTGDLISRGTYESQTLPNSKKFWMNKLFQ